MTGLIWMILLLGAAFALVRVLSSTGEITRELKTTKGDFERIGHELDAMAFYDVVGESKYQKNFEKLVGPKTEDGFEEEVTVELVPEPTNPKDPSAVAAYVRGTQLGYLSKLSARDFVARNGTARRQMHGTIVGGWDRGDGDTGHFGLKLGTA